jgi:hypothetical protein
MMPVYFLPLSGESPGKTKREKNQEETPEEGKSA